MSPEAQRIAIAKACGWTRFTPDTIQYTAQRADGKWGLIPDYLNDLNAMNEAEKILNGLNYIIYMRNVMLVVDPKIQCHTSQREFRFLRATAAQRAEAFLKTLNLWTE